MARIKEKGEPKFRNKSNRCMRININIFNNSISYKKQLVRNCRENYQKIKILLLK